MRGSFVNTLTTGASCKKRARPYLRQSRRYRRVRLFLGNSREHSESRGDRSQTRGVKCKTVIVRYVRVAQLAKGRSDEELGEADPGGYPREQANAARRTGQCREELQARLQTHCNARPGRDQQELELVANPRGQPTDAQNTSQGQNRDRFARVHRHMQHQHCLASLPLRCAELHMFIRLVRGRHIPLYQAGLATDAATPACSSS